MDSNVATQTRSHLTVVEGRKGRLMPSKDPLDRREYGKTVRQHVREFGAVMGLVLCAIAAMQLRHPGTLSMVVGLVSAAIVVYALGVFAPRLMLKPWEGWMALAHALGFVMTGVILSLSWALMVIPIGFGLRLFGVRVMDSSFRATVSSYWEDRDPKLADFKLLERQY